MYSSTTNQLFHPHLTTLPIPSVNLCDLLLYETKIAEDVGSATSSSYVDSNEHYDNTCTHTYDNPIECLENVRLLFDSFFYLLIFFSIILNKA